MQAMLVFFIGLFFGALTAYFAQGRGRNPTTWFFVGFFFGLLGLLSLFLFPVLPEGMPPAVPEVPSVPDPLSDREWYYLTADRSQVGPISYKELQLLQNENAVGSETYVWCDALTDWKRMHEIEKMRHNRTSR